MLIGRFIIRFGVIIIGVSRIVSVIVIFQSVLRKIRIIIFTLIIRVPDMSLIDFDVVLLSNVNLVDFVDLSVVYALLRYDPRFEIRGFLKCHV